MTEEQQELLSDASDVMVDLETFGTGNRACILSIGACRFNPKGQGVPEDDAHRFHVYVDPESCVEIGMDTTVSTLMWWLDPERRPAWDVQQANNGQRVHIYDALNRFASWIGKDKPVWGNGATFDNVILRNAYQLAGKETPWAFWNDRCYRTMKSQVPCVKMQRVGVHHVAMWDAISQALHLQQIFSYLSGEQ